MTQLNRIRKEKHEKNTRIFENRVNESGSFRSANGTITLYSDTLISDNTCHKLDKKKSVGWVTCNYKLNPVMICRGTEVGTETLA